MKTSEVIDIYCYVEGMKFDRTIVYRCLILGLVPNKLSWSFQSGLLPSNTYTTNDGHLLIYNFDRFNLGTYTCSAETSTKRLSQSIDFQPNHLFNNIGSTLSFQIYTSRTDYHFGGRLFIECISSSITLIISCYRNRFFLQILDSNDSKIWIKQQGKLTKNTSKSFLFINKLSRKDLAHYQCLSSNETIYFNITRSNLLTRTFPLESKSNIHIEFLSSINQMKLNGNILINCSSSDQTPVRWLLNKQINGIIINNSYLHIPKFSNNHSNFYDCVNKNTRKVLVLSPILFNLIQTFNLRRTNLIQLNKSSIEIIQGKYIGDNITLICRIGRGSRYFL
jgi:hypothetical protein